MSFTLFEFQDRVVTQLADAIGEWMTACNKRGGRPPEFDDASIPLFAHLTAITGAGKTPILAKVIGGVGPAIVLWTTNRSVVVDQTAEKLAEVYRHFLPAKTTFITDRPTAAQWNSLMDDEDGLVIWCLTVASWNEAEGSKKGSEAARLNIHRPAPDWAGERSPWDQLGDPAARKRDLWVVYDESHGQTEVQLDQLIDLSPFGMIAASATPAFSQRIETYRNLLLASDTWRSPTEKAMVEVPTTEVAKAGLLKSVIELTDLNTDDESKVLAAVEQLGHIEETARDNGVFLSPRAIYVTEESDRKSGEPRPVTLWRLLTERCGIRPEQIAVATSTRELPHDAERVTDLVQLRSGHKHVIFNKKFQEGWDDPECYVAYFDGETKSATRIRQIIGRVIRQPNARPFDGLPDLNTAFIFVSAPDRKFESIVENIRRSLIEEFGRNDDGEAAVKTRTRAERPASVPLRADLPTYVRLPRMVISAAGLTELHAMIETEGEREFMPDKLEAPGQAVSLRVDMTDAKAAMQRQVRPRGRHIRTLNRLYFEERVAALSRQAYEHIPAWATDGTCQAR